MGLASLNPFRCLSFVVGKLSLSFGALLLVDFSFGQLLWLASALHLVPYWRFLAGFSWHILLTCPSRYPWAVVEMSLAGLVNLLSTFHGPT
jgi:hypothetical protein